MGGEKGGVRLANGDGGAEAFDTLAQDWSAIRVRESGPTHDQRGLLFLNPEFSEIAPYSAKCLAESKREAKSALLVPASTGSLWYAHHVHDKALVLFLRPRLSFDGKAPYPKDCLLALHGERPGFETWDWTA